MLDTYIANSYNIFDAEVAQSVEQRTENPRVPSSILGLGTSSFSESPFVLPSLLPLQSPTPYEERFHLA